MRLTCRTLATAENSEKHVQRKQQRSTRYNESISKQDIACFLLRVLKRLEFPTATLRAPTLKEFKKLQTCHNSCIMPCMPKNADHHVSPANVDFVAQ